jgi:catechol 2,3-dioxygenase
VIGFRVLERADGVARLGPNGADVTLLEIHEKPGVHSVGRRGRIGLYHFAILLPNRAALGRFLKHLADIGEQAGMSDHFVSEAIYLSDPDGIGIEVYADRPRSAWRHEARQLAMTTIPLDVDDLVAAGGDEPWTGAPEGTVIGHIHLYVRDIDQAAAFYHDALGFDKIVWSYPGALFMSAGGYHHHLGTNTWAASAPVATDDDAKLIEWEVVVPTARDVADAAASLESSGFRVERHGETAAARDPWGTQLRLVGEAR